MTKKNKSYIKLYKFSPLISETLPYELPMRFSNRLLYYRIQKAYDGNMAKIFKEKNLKIKSDIAIPSAEDFFKTNYLPKQVNNIIDAKYFIPYKYKINKDAKNKRLISLIHPMAQIKVCDFYDDYNQLIIYYCNRSAYSLRHPYKKTSIVHRKYFNISTKMIEMNDAQTVQTKNIYEELEEDAENLKPEDFLTNYFIYKKYNMLYKFYNSEEYIDLEKKYKYLLKLDILRCFDSIYTHSIEWSIKSIEYIKNNLNKTNNKKNKSFGAEFDKLMTVSNYSETNGIPIGAEVSRIFAEIILQAIDDKIHCKLEKYKISVRRYVDDYYIFFNDIKLVDEIEGVIKEELEEYKFSINKNKKEIMEHPFITIETFVKNKISNIIKDFAETCFVDENKERVLATKNEVSSRKVIKEIRDILYYEKIDPMKISGIILSKLQKILINICLLYQKGININHEKLRRILFEILKISFYIANISVKCETTYKLVKIIYIAIKLAKKTTDIIVMDLSDYIFSEILSIFEIYEDVGLPVDFLDLMTILNEMPQNNNYKISPDRLNRLFKLDKKNDEQPIRYFDVMILLSYIKDDALYLAVKRNLLNKIMLKLDSHHNFIVTEDFLMFFDLIKCPFITESDKLNILEKYKIIKDKRQCIQDIMSKDWFFDWGNHFDIDEILSIKELNFNSY